MKFTIDDCISRINQVLNYPSLTYGDVYHFFDQAISELNTSLRIALPSVTEMLDEHTFNITEHENVIRLTTLPGASDCVTHYQTEDELPTDGSVKAAYVCKQFGNRAFYVFDGSWRKVDKLYAIYVNGSAYDAFVAVPLSSTMAVWAPTNVKTVTEFDLVEYMPLDWWILFMIPYVCFKFAVRNGDSGELFRDEFTQGFQQLQTSYTVPNTVKLYTVAGRSAYKNDVESYASNLNTDVPTRAIYSYMRLKDSTMPIYGGFYETGGWGL